MSDRSTNASKVPECEPKTCGNPILFGDGYEMQFDDSSQTENWRQGIEGINWNKVKWVDIDGVNFIPEQRHQQLQQVAREMYDFIAATCTDEAYVTQPKFYYQLKELGVSVDD